MPTITAFVHMVSPQIEVFDKLKTYFQHLGQ